MVLVADLAGEKTVLALVSIPTNLVNGVKYRKMSVLSSKQKSMVYGSGTHISSDSPGICW